MANEILKDEILNDKELDMVTGGSAKEFTKIVSAMFSNKTLRIKLKDALANVDGNISLKNMAEPVTKILGEMRIDAELIIGAGKNSYKDIKTSKPISHDEVINRIENFI